MFSIYNSPARRFASLTISLLASTIVLGACDDDPVDPTDTVEWDATLAGTDEFEDVEGIAAVSATSTSFDAAIEIANAAAEAVYTWQIAEDTCAEPGDRIGEADSYPDLEVGADGTAEAEADVTGVLTEDGEYIVRILDETGDEPVTVACAALELDE